MAWISLWALGIDIDIQVDAVKVYTSSHLLRGIFLPQNNQPNPPSGHNVLLCCVVA